ncbi:MAG TPA: response regulator [Ktedonobacteraceae bacterium]|jgi:DNA-binding response OmpR family regulator|nr:response regulator [Ktedonobacteraceae bacterium]
MAKRILVVNDTPEILEMFQLLLEGEGYEVILSSFPYKKISDIEKINPDLIILDYIFNSEKTGWQMLQLLKMQHSTAHIPVIVCTAAEDKVREQEGHLLAQGVRVLYKPFEIDELLEMIRDAFKTQQQSISQQKPKECDS